MFCNAKMEEGKEIQNSSQIYEEVLRHKLILEKTNMNVGTQITRGSNYKSGYGRIYQKSKLISSMKKTNVVAFTNRQIKEASILWS